MLSADVLTVTVDLRTPWYFKAIGRPLAFGLLGLVRLRLLTKQRAYEAVCQYVNSTCWVRIGDNLAEWQRLKAS